MRLISVTVRNYRVHRELTLHFDRARTLIGGPNEAGKSTLIEAVHRALFFPAKSAAEPQKRMRSNLHPGHPEVDLAFEAGGHVFQLRKRFSGTTGTTTLTRIGNTPWHGAEAEEQLARLFKIPADTTAKGSTECWAHLWVWQGVSGDNPDTHVTTQRDALLARLQTSGGAGAMQSDLDGKVAAHFTQVLERTVTQAGKPKAGSEWEAAESDAQAAGLACAEAADRLTRLRQAMTDVEQASVAIAAAERDRVSLTVDLGVVSEKSERAARLQQQFEKEERLARESGVRLDALIEAQTRVADLERELTTIRETLAPVQAELANRETARIERARIATAMELAAQAAADQVRGIHLRRELAATQVLILEKQLEHREVSERLAEARLVEQELSTQRLHLAQLPPVDGPRVRKLQQMESECATARASLAAMAAGLEVVVSDCPVVIGGQRLEAGHTHILAEDTEVQVGAGTRLRIRPGGGRSLSEARDGLHAAQQRLQHALDEHGLASVSAAVETAARRDTLVAQIKTGETRLADFKLPALVTKLNTLGEAIAAAEGRIARLRLDVPDAVAPDPATARLAAAALEQELRDVQMAERRARTASDSAQNALREADAAFEQQRQMCEQRGRSLTAGEAQLKLLVETQGDAAARAAAIAAARTERTVTAQAVTATRHALEALQPGLLAGTILRLQRAIDEKRRVIQEADTKKAVAQTLLSSDGSRDPQAEFDQGEARRRFATDRLASARRRVAAVQLLHDLFREEQRRLADQFTRPLADKVSGYLRCVFGPQARFAISLQEKTFSALQLVRAEDGQGAVPFETLSGGTREQVSAAVRLAMAELLAVNFDGCLPVVFDDAFAYSDPHRVNILQGMLDLAAQRGLQIVVLSCNPADYASLGAREIQLASRLKDERGASPTADGRSGPAGAMETQTPATVAETQRDLLRTVLRHAGGSNANQALRAKLGWSEAEYAAVMSDLVLRGEVVAEQGHTGRVILKHS